MDTLLIFNRGLGSIRYHPIALPKQHDQGNMKKGFVWTYGSNGIRALCRHWEMHRADGHGGWSSELRNHILNHRQEAESELAMVEVLNSKSPVMYFLQQGHSS